MCIRYETVRDQKRLNLYFGSDLPQRLAHADVWPGKPCPFIRQARQDSGKSSREALIGSFGLVPHWAMDAQIGRQAYNARCETVANKPSFRDAWVRAQHCIVPLEAFYEPDWRSGKPLPARIGHAKGEPLGAAGLWSAWEDDNGDVLYSFALLTQNADKHPLMKMLHKSTDEKRMLVLLPPERYDDWLHADASQSARLLRNWPVELTVGSSTELQLAVH